MIPLRPWAKRKPKGDELVDRYAQEGVTKDMLFGKASAPDPVPEPSPPAAPGHRAMSFSRMLTIVGGLLRPVLSSFSPIFFPRVTVDQGLRDVEDALRQVDQALEQLPGATRHVRCSRGQDACTGASHHTCLICGEADVCRSHICRYVYRRVVCSHGETGCSGSAHYTCWTCGERGCCGRTVHYCPSVTAFDPPEPTPQVQIPFIRGGDEGAR